MYNLDEQAIIFFSAFDLTYKKQQEIFSLTSNYSQLISNFNNYSKQIEKIVNDTTIFNDICKNLSDNFLSDYINNLNKSNIQCLTICSKDYPESLKNIDQTPYILFCKGNISLLKLDGIAIVGTRTPTSYGKIITEQFAKGLAINDFVIISGMAAGVDTISHRTALDNGGKTIAVLGSGFEHIYPAFNKELFRKISEQGLLISEYKPSTKPALYTFPFRNRIIAGLSKGVLITEAGEKSGSLHTKEYALEMGKEVFAVPGNIDCRNSAGTNALLRDGASFALSGSDILYEMMDRVPEKFRKIDSFGEESETEEKVAEQVTETTVEDCEKHLSPFERSVINALKTGKETYEEIMEFTQMEAAKLTSVLTIMEIKGIIKLAFRNKYKLND